MTFITETIAAEIISKVSKLTFEKARDFIKFDPTNKLKVSDDIKKIILNAYHDLSNCEYFKILKKEDFELILIKNINLICQWFFNPFSSNFDSSMIEIPNYSIERQTKDFLNGLFTYISNHKNEYSSFCLQAISLQISNSTNQLASQISTTNLIMQQNFTQMMNILQQNTELLTANNSFKNDFNSIDNLLKCKKTNEAKILLNHIENKVLLSSDKKILESLYFLYTKYYMLTFIDDNSLLLDSLSKLIDNTSDEINKEYRIALLHIYKDEFNEALEIINKNITTNFSLYMEIKAYVLLNTKQFDELSTFLKTCNEKFRNLWNARSLLNQENYKEAFNLVNDKIFSSYNDFEYVFVTLQIKTYYYLSIQHEVKKSSQLREECTQLINQIDEAITNVGDDILSHGELLNCKMLLFLLLDFVEYSNLGNFITELDSLNCQNPNYLKNKAIYFITKKEYKTAFEILDDWCIKYPDAIETKELRAIAFYSFDPEQAREEFNKLDNNPENIAIKIKIFYSYMKEYNFSEAHKWLLDFSKNNISSFYIYAAFGDYYLQMGEAQLAYSNYLSALKSNDGYYSKLDYYAQLLRLTCQSLDPQKFNECIQFKDLLDNHDMIKNYYNEIASVYLTFKDFDEALIVVNKAKQINGTTPYINYLEMLCYVNKHDFNKVIEIYMDSNDDIQVKEDINQKYKIFIDAAIRCNKEIEKAKNLYQILEKPSTEEDYKQHTYYAEHFSTPQEYVKLCLEGINKYPNSIILLENFLLSCINTKLHLKDIELYKTYKEIEQKYISLPENGKTNRLGVGIIWPQEIL